MSTSTAKSPPKPPPAPPPRLSTGEEVITAAIRDAQAALWRAELSRSLLTLVIASLVVLVGWAVVDQWVWSPGPLVRTLVLAAGVAGSTAWVLTRVLPLLRSRIRADYAAYSIEHDLPELRHALTSYVSLRDDVEVMGPRGAIVRSIGARAAGQMKQHRLEVPSEATGTFNWWIGLAVSLAVVAAYGLLSPKDTLQSTQRLLLPLARIDAPTRVTISQVQPGDCEVLADRPLEISAELVGLSSRDEPSVQFGPGFAQRQPLQLDASSGRFSATIRVPRSTQYRISAGDALAGPFDITARDVPVASVRSVQIVPPTYTQLPPRQSTGGAVTAEENSQVTITATVNRAIQRARMEFNPRKTTERTGPSAGSVEMQVASDGLSATATVPLRLPREKHAAVAIDSYHVRVWDAEGNENPDPIVYPVRIIPDLPPEVSIVSPREVVKEIPINAQQLFEIAALDPDYGLRRIELTWRRGVDLPVSEILWSSEPAARGNQVTEYRFRPAALGLRVGDKLQVSAVAIDSREDLNGKPEPNHSQTQPIELLIVAAQQLPPVSAPEDGLSEPDDEPARGGGSQQSDQGGSADGDAQAGGGSAGGDSGAAGEGAQQDGQSGSGSGQGNEQDSAAENQSSGSGQSTESSSSGDQTGQGTTLDGAGSDRSSHGGNSDRSSQQPTGNSQSADRGNPGENSSGAPAESQAGGNNPTGEQGDTPESGASHDRTQNGSNTGQGANQSSSSDQQGNPATGESQAGDSLGSDSAADAQQDPSSQSSNGQNPSDAAPSPGESSAPPQHDGDAFERIRDYLNQKQQQQAARQPSPAASEQPDRKGDSAGENEPADDLASADQPAGDSSQPAGANPNGGNRQATADQSSQSGESSTDPTSPATPTPTDSREPDPARPAGGNSTDPAAGDSDTNSSSAAGEERSDGSSSEPRDSSQRPQPGTADRGAGDATTGEAEAETKSDGNNSPPEPTPSADRSNPRNAARPDDKSTDGAAQSPQGEGSSAESDAASAEGAGSAQPSSGAQTGTPSSASGDRPGDSPGQASGGDGGEANVLGDGGQGSETSALPPDPVDLEHARQATDLVLDYLDQNRDTPDPKLLERLNWTPEELRDFTDRWRELLRSQPDAGSGTDQQQVEEALRSLGLRKPTQGPIGEIRGRDDALRGLRDGGNRPPAPTLYRDAFDAFRRGLGRP